jgi:hypothetical protein
MTEQWYNWLTFDIIGDLAFGESFSAVENAKNHPWVYTLKNSIFDRVFEDVFRRVPLLKVFPLLLRPSGLMEHRKEMFRLSKEKAKARIGKGNHRDDF